MAFSFKKNGHFLGEVIFLVCPVYSYDTIQHLCRLTVTYLATLTESDCTVVLQQKCDSATLIIFISTTTTTTLQAYGALQIRLCYDMICI